MESHRWDFFIAYSSTDAASAEDLYSRLSSRSRTFIDSRCLKLGDDWDVALSEAQRSSKVTVVLVSANSDHAFYQREEIAAAISLARADPSGARIVPVYLEGSPQQADAVPYGLRIKHGIAILGDVTMDDVAERLLDLLADLGGSKAAPQVVAASSDDFKYTLDLCICVDTGGKIIGGPAEMRVLREAQTIPSLLKAHMELKNKPLGAIRVRCISFSAEIASHRVGTDQKTPFYDESSNGNEIIDFFKRIRTQEPSTVPTVRSNAIWALKQAFTSSWTTSTRLARHIIVIWADSIPSFDANELDSAYELWQNMDNRTKRLLLYAPECDFWKSLAENFENTIWLPSDAGDSLTGLELDEILNAIANSIL
jgi:hypothetical protein